MALEFLRREIFQQTAALKLPRHEALSRTFYLILSPSMGHLRDWFHKWFPASDGHIRHIQPWYIVDKMRDAAELKDIIASLFLEAFSVEITNKLTAKGYHVLNTSTQVILIGDLTEEGFGDSMEKVYTSFKEVADQFMSHESPLYFTGLFLCGNIGKNDAGKVIIKNCKDFTKVVKWVEDKLDRLFLVDISNPNNAVVCKETDLHFLVGQLLYLLTKKPLEYATEHNPAAFDEWMRRVCPSERRCSGFSGISILSPVDQMLETLLIAKGGEVLNEAFFSNINEEQVKLYLNSLLNKTHLNSEAVFEKMLIENRIYPLIKPFINIDEGKTKWDISCPEDFTAYIDSLDAQLQVDAEENKRIMANLSQKLLDDFRYSVLEHLNAAIANERGGLLVAEKFLHELKKLLTQMIPENETNLSYPDISNLIMTLESRCKQGPRKESVIARTFVLAAVAALGVLSSKVMFDVPFIGFTLLSLTAAAGGILYWHGSKYRVENLVSDIWNNLFGKWNKLMANETSSIFASLIPQFLSIIDELAMRVKEASARMSEVVTFFRNQYVAALSEDSAFWMYAMNDRNDFIKYLPLLSVDLSTIASEYLKEERPLELWNRTAAPGTTDLNEWEWSLGERIGLRLLPYCQNIMHLSVSKVLSDSPEQTSNFAELLKRSAQPYLNIKPGSPRCIAQGTIEMPEDGSDALYKKLRLRSVGVLAVLKEKAQ